MVKASEKWARPRFFGGKGGLSGHTEEQTGWRSKSREKREQVSIDELSELNIPGNSQKLGLSSSLVRKIICAF